MPIDDWIACLGDEPRVETEEGGVTWAGAPDDSQKTAVTELALRRESARRSKDFAEADRLRGEIQELGFKLVDTSAGPRIEPGPLASKANSGTPVASKAASAFLREAHRAQRGLGRCRTVWAVERGPVSDVLAVDVTVPLGIRPRLCDSEVAMSPASPARDGQAQSTGLARDDARASSGFQEPGSRGRGGGKR